MKIIREILWGVVAIVLSGIILFPIVSKIDYIYIVSNFIILFLAIFYFRATLDFKRMFFVSSKTLRYVLFASNLFLFVYVVTRIQKVLILFDVYSITAYAKSYVDLSLKEETKLIHYINQEYLLASISLLVLILVLNMKILRSFWKK